MATMSSIAKALLLAALPLASADVPITVQMYTSSDCSGSPTAGGTSTDPLTDAETMGGTSHPAGMCIGGNNELGGGVSFMGSCPSLTTTTMQQYNVATSTVTQQGMRYCWMVNGACSGTCGSSAVTMNPSAASWSVPACQSFTAVFGGPSSSGINSMKFSCGDQTTSGTDDPCFPSSSMVTKADGTLSRIDALKEGDAIVAASHDGTLTTDTVTLLSIAKPEVEGAAYVALATAANKTLTLTAGHHVPVGAECCSTLKQAKDVVVGETMWAVKDGAATATTVTAKTSSVKATGLHSPVLVNGGFPVVDGVVTSFDSIEKVTLAKYGLAPLLQACKATGTCKSLREMFLSADDRRYIA